MMSIEVAKAIIELKQAQDALLECYRQQGSKSTKSTELTRRRFLLDLKTAALTSLILEEYGDSARDTLRDYQTEHFYQVDAAE